ncbi:MlaD family protein [Marispirochaeta sp.]|jgi:phospholipid/cholesterol/gamma-HCH transport system substrate-binding protein|uniref:MlaD family protein n=1 Tax=Marispirochaeta sp. TaxID=2038653 RepID=UPI0029C8E008|nr:MlaD family protein [Marispirochaeta sp.]
MKFKIRYAEQITGIFVLVAIFFVGLVLILMGINQRWFKNDPSFYSTFNSAEDLKRGMSIKLKGFQIGTVKSIRLLEDNRVEIRFSIFDNYHEKIHENSILDLSSNPLGLGGGLILYPGLKPTAPLEDGSFIPSIDFEEGKRLVSAGLVQISESDAINMLMNDVSKIIGVAMDTMASLNELVVTATSTLAGDNPGPVGGTIRNVESITAQLADSMGELTSRLNNTMANVESLSREISQPRKFMSEMVASDSSIAMFLDDKARLYTEIEGILSGINKTIVQMEEFAVFINATSPQLSGIIEDGRVALDHGKDVLEGLKNNPFLRGGISDTPEQAAIYKSYRDKDF